ncbi:Receptor-like protein kinase [Melia azedarach]|uniref:Receptor-like protein kinase n=1 Tax=Melia azedarach TaxID=155640 RepID=A0ACC1Y5G2_MELAZ|nr:Receptor-like protein kinase [Melia azedarach]
MIRLISWLNIGTRVPLSVTGLVLRVIKFNTRGTALNISGLNHTGTIPFQLGNLSSLQKLALDRNHLFGTIPSSVVSIRTLRALHLFDNQLSGSFPSLNNVSSLVSLDFTNNSLTGQLPANICNYFPFLRGLYLSRNMFHGEIPSILSECKQLVDLSLSINNFSGSIPKEIGNLTNLKVSYLGFNLLKGEIPQELGYLTKLKLLSLRKNLFTGIIPSSVFNLTSISSMDFSENNLTSSLPDDMSHRLSFLQKLYMYGNQFTGRIPRDIGNLTSAKVLDLGSNHLIGEIPREIGNLLTLEVLILAHNNLTGVVPTSIFNMSRIKLLGLEANTLTGSFPSSIDLGLPNLERLYLALNNFSGPIPNFILNASKLSVLEMFGNAFSGFIPNTLGNLRNLKRLSLGENYLTSSDPELSFLSSLTYFNNLEILYLGKNPLDGILPSSIGNLSNSLKQIDMCNCNISGSIPEEIGNLISLTRLNLGHNGLNGSIPVSLGRLQKLQGLSLQFNKLQGSISDNDLCHLTAIFMVLLDGNKLSGSIPSCIGNLSTLRIFWLSSNEFTSIPSTFWTLKDILSFNFSSNSLTGPLPMEIENLKVVQLMDLSKNLFSGVLPTTISGLKDLQFLSLGYNRLKGPIPETFGKLISLDYLDLSNNNLSEVIPKSMEKLLYLKYLNLSFNRLEGEIPRGGPFGNFTAKSFMGNDLLCGSPNLQVPQCKTRKIRSHRKSRKKVLVLGIVFPLSTAFMLSLGFLLVRRCRKRITKLPNDAKMTPPATRRRFSYLELSRATERFSESNLIGMGSFGSVYKARFQDGMEAAVKVFHLQFEGALKSFDAESEVMKSIRHRNLVKIISSCANDDFKALVLEYMPNGSLEKCLYSNHLILDIFQRLSIMIDVASALEYLHFGCLTPIIHCDLKPSNVLLDENMVAHLSDFGIAKLLTGDDQSFTQTQTLATIGYMAPEQGREGKILIKVDIYSYGIMLMEAFTGKKPTDEFFVGEMSLKSWVRDLLHSSVTELVDKSLLRRDDQHFAAKEQCVSSVLNLAMACTAELPENRINAKDIVTGLVKITRILLGAVEGRRRIKI